MHAGPETTLAILHEKIWLTQGRRDIKRVLRKCLVCRHQVTTPCTQKMAPLPQERVQFTHAFSVIGVDFAGHSMPELKGGLPKCTSAFSLVLHHECFIWSSLMICQQMNFFKLFIECLIVEVCVTWYGLTMLKSSKLLVMKLNSCLVHH